MSNTIRHDIPVREYGIRVFIKTPNPIDLTVVCDETQFNAKVKEVLKKVFDQCHALDKMNVDKEEMHRPYKHIIVKGNNPVMIDFERANYSKKPKNVTQFLQFINSGRFSNVLKKKGFKINKKEIIKESKRYKRTKDKEIIKKIIQGL